MSCSLLCLSCSKLFPRAPTRNYKVIDGGPQVEKPYYDLTWIHTVYSFDTDLAHATGTLTLVKTPVRYKIWTLHTVIEGLQGFPEVPSRDGHMTGNLGWNDQRKFENDLKGVQPEVVVIGGGHCGLQITARLKALGVTALFVERNKRIGDNWRNRYEYLSLHLPHWGDHFAYFPFPEHWPTYTLAGKMGDWLEWCASALDLPNWTDSNIVSATKDEQGAWEVVVERESGSPDGKHTRTLRPKHVIMATSLAGVPYIPDLPGMDKFQGTIRHSSQHASGRGWEGKKALVIGTSSSGFDTAYDFARWGACYTAAAVAGLCHTLGPVYGPKGHKKPDLEAADRVAHALPTRPAEELFRRTARDIWDADAELIAKMEKAGFKVWRGQRDTGQHTLANTRNGGFYFDAGACGAIIDGSIKVEQGYPVRFTDKSVVLDGEREQEYDIVILATGFSSTVESVRETLGDDIANKVKPIWGVDEEGEYNCAWKFSGVENLWIMVGSLQPARFHTQKLALRLKALLEGIGHEPYAG